ncbi:MAG: Mrp/NBP35 family ATP-binding protein [Clostridia bacterium]|nr:Mrp/NBP35 family ATP-binding protein [Clostridia bacterium]
MACNHNCSSCSDSSCKDRDFTVKPKDGTSIKKIIAVTSGKGGVGKSLVTTLLAVEARKQGLKVGVLDADVTGPSIPKSFGLTENDRAQGSEEGLIPVQTKSGIKIMSINLLLEDPTQPVVWRGPVISGVVKQFFTDVLWGELDVLFIDMPPGTGDVPLTVFQSLKVDGIVVVTTPQDLVSLIVEKSVKMAELMNVKVLGIVENMSYYVCPDCGKKLYVFGKGKTDEVAKKYGTEKLLELAISEEVRTLVDNGDIESANTESITSAINKIMEN